MDFRFSEVTIKGGFLHALQEKNRQKTMDAVYDRFVETGRFAAMECDWKEGMDRRPHHFWDSDVAKWIEGAAYILEKHPDAALEAKVEAAIDAWEHNQWADGYINSYYTTIKPEKRFQNRDRHELYCAGHMIEAAVAYYCATGRDRFLRIMEKYVELIERIFVHEHSAVFDTPGHEEIELALVRLYRATGKCRYLDLAAHFVNTRGTSDRDAMPSSYHNGKPAYSQSHLPVREQTEAVGHAVRAMYLYCAMEDLANELGDEGLRSACRRLFADVTERKMHITGGIGTTRVGEAFTIPFDLPLERTYNETCGSIGLMFFAQRLLESEPRGIYADTVERALYNGMLAGLSLDGTSFFYENPMEINVKNGERIQFDDRAERYPIRARVKVFSCSCCPPNINRLFASFERYLYHVSDGIFFVDQFAESEWCEAGAKVTQKTNYPLDGTISLRFEGVKRAAVRIPGWCERYTCNVPVTIQDGYAYIDAPTDVELTFEMKPTIYTAHVEVDSCAGRAAIVYGPVVYCAERVDNPVNLHRLLLVPELNATKEKNPLHGLWDLTVDGLLATPTGEGLFTRAATAYEKTRIRLIPYFAFANRGESDMQVWLRYRD